VVAGQQVVHVAALIGEWWGDVLASDGRNLGRYFLTIRQFGETDEFVLVELYLPQARRGSTDERFVATLAGRTVSYRSPLGRAATLTLSEDGRKLSGPFNNGPDVRGTLELLKR
jgi:hypothetical protein